MTIMAEAREAAEKAFAGLCDAGVLKDGVSLDESIASYSALSAIGAVGTTCSGPFFGKFHAYAAAKEAAEQIKAGDVVVLKTGGPRIIVNRVGPGVDLEPGMVEATWFNSHSGAPIGGALSAIGAVGTTWSGPFFGKFHTSAVNKERAAPNGSR